MNKNKLAVTIALVMAAVLIAAIVFTGCGKVAEFSDPIAENILVSMNNADYAGFSKDFDEVMKAELNEESFPDILAQINGNIGDYKEGSKKLFSVNINNELTTAAYTADFEKTENVTVTIVLQKIDGQMKVVGLWFK